MECREIYSLKKAAQERTFIMKNPVSRLCVDVLYAFFTVAAQPQTKDVEKHSCQQLTVLTVNGNITVWGTK